MTLPHLARVLVIDNDQRVGLELQDILVAQGYQVEIAQGIRRDLLEQAVLTARQFRPHVAVVDLRLLDDYTDERSGLELLSSLKSARCILYSAYLTPEVIREAVKRYGATDWVNKQDSPQLLLDAINAAAVESCAGQREMSIHRPSSWTSQRSVQTLFGQDTRVPPEAVEDVLNQLFPKSSALTLEPVGWEVSDSLSVSRGHSVVLKVQAEDLEPVILKLAPADQLRREEGNYYAHVKDRLVGRFYAQVEQTVEFWELGGAVYSFIGSSLRTLPTFTTFYQQETNPPAILKPLSHFFAEVWSRHYNHPLPTEHVSLFQLYDASFRLRDRLKRLDHGVACLTFPGLPAPLINPVAWVLRHSHDSLIQGARQAITHGDLHGDNLFVDGKHAWVIDFERTGPGHILRDFVELEVDIVTRLLPFPPNDLAQFYELVQVLAEPATPSAPFQPSERLQADSASRKALAVIAGLRHLAYGITQYSDSREYLWGLLLDALFVASLTSPEAPQRDRALLLSAVLCDHLSR